jgi:hypothetical protein
MPVATMTATDIEFRGSSFSAFGVDNLGGTMGAILPIPILNNIFDDLDGKASRRGLTDYRCIYVRNKHATETLRNVRLFIDSQRMGGASIELGATLRNEIQKVVITGGKPNEGNTMTLDLPGLLATGTPASFTVVYDPNITKWVGNFQTEMRGVGELVDSVVTVVSNIVGTVFTVKFLGQVENHGVPMISVISNDLDNAFINVIGDVAGSPVGTIAPTIPNRTSIPPGINFLLPLKGNPLKLGDLRPKQSVPIWVKRIIPANTMARIKDNFVLQIYGTFP